MNDRLLQKNVTELLDHDDQEASVENKTGGKFNARLPYEYVDLLTRVAILEGCSKTDVFKRALHAYSRGFRKVLYPRTP